MKRLIMCRVIGLPLVAALALAGAYCEGSESAGHGERAGAVAKAEAPAAKPAGGEKRCEEHGLPESECGICHPERAAGLKPGEGSKVRLPAADSAAFVGVETGAATLGKVSAGIDCYAELAFNQNKLAQIAAPVGGIVQAVETDLGDKVDEKQRVASIWSATIAEGVAKAVLTHQTLERERKLRADRVTSEKDLQQAEAEHRAACQQAANAGVQRRGH